MNLAMLPVHLRDGINRYVLDGILPGEFLRAVICNDFVMAMMRFGPGLTPNDLRGIAQFMHNEAPALCWGSAAVMRHWSQFGGENGGLLGKQHPEYPKLLELHHARNEFFSQAVRRQERR